MIPASLPQVEREVGGIRFQITKLPFRLSRSVLLTLAQRGLPAIKSALADTAIVSTSSLTPKVLAALADAVGSLTERELDQLEEAFGAHCAYANGEDAHGTRWAPMVKANREALFGGGNMLLYTKWVAACVEVNYADFFAVAQGKTAPS